jgi:hypothetical protein
VLHQLHDEVLIQLSSAEQRFIALDWTDQAAPPVALAGSRFLLDHLVTLRQRLDAFSHKRLYSGTIPPQKDRQLEGGTHGTDRSDEVGPIVPGTTSAGHCHFSTDDSASTVQASGGETR